MTIAAALLFILAGITVTLIVLTWAGERSHKLDVLLEQSEAEMAETYAPEHSSHLRGQKTRRIDPAAVQRAVRDE
jgi:hypothetical protein